MKSGGEELLYLESKPVIFVVRESGGRIKVPKEGNIFRIFIHFSPF